jgi:hypothetical protein
VRRLVADIRRPVSCTCTTGFLGNPLSLPGAGALRLARRRLQRCCGRFPLPGFFLSCRGDDRYLGTLGWPACPSGSFPNTGVEFLRPLRLWRHW